MSIPFLTPLNITGSIASVSYFNESDYNLYKTELIHDNWFGLSDKDVIELSIFDLDGNQVKWDVIHKNTNSKIIHLQFLNEKNEIEFYSYNQLQSNFIQYKNDKILLNAVSDVKLSGIKDGSFFIIYNFIRNMAGNITDQLSIKDISPSRKEIKLIYHRGNENTIFEAFCLKKFQLKDIISLILAYIQNINCDAIYKNIKFENQKSIDLIKALFFLPNDDKFVSFLRELYNDIAIYTKLNKSQIDSGIDPDQISRIPGIKTLFGNFLLRNYESIIDFSEIKQNFEFVVKSRVDKRFNQIGKSSNTLYFSAKNFVYDFYIKHFFDEFISNIQNEYEDKYFSPFKNALNFGNNRFLKILNHSSIKESSGELVLLVKLADRLDDDISIKDTCWVSNIAMVPYMFRTVVKNPLPLKTFKLGNPDFSLKKDFISNDVPIKESTESSLIENITNTQKQNIFVENKLKEFNVDYTSFSNFINFSSAELRLNVFKNKMIQLFQLSSSLSTINSNVTASSNVSIQSSYSTEKTDTQAKIDDLIESFDGYESFLYKTGDYNYNLNSRSFAGSTTVENNDKNAKVYDKNNRDSLINNTPEYILLDSENDEYLIFLSMIGHFFDNIYNAISVLPSVKSSANDIEKSISKNILEQKLKSLGWNVDAFNNAFSSIDTLLDLETGNSNQSMSSEKRLQTVWNRILFTLPQIYKTKGTEECVRLFLSCFGIPSTLMSIKEYGGINNVAVDNKVTYSQNEKSFLLTYSKHNEYIKIPYSSSISTVEFKFSVNNVKNYTNYQKVPLLAKENTQGTKEWEIGIIKKPEKFLGNVYFNIINNFTQSVSYELSSSNMPIFNGDIFSLMVRKNAPNVLFESNDTSDLVPAKYDLYVQKNDDGREIFKSTSSAVLTREYNLTFRNSGSLFVGNKNSNLFEGLMDKILLWNSPVLDSNYLDYVNNISSYSYSGSFTPYEALYFRFHYDVPVDLYTSSFTSSISNANEYYSSSISASAFNFPIIGFTASLDAIGCPTVSSSAYPFQFKQHTSVQSFLAPNYGPNIFKNNRISKIEQTVDTRLDVSNKSTEIKNKYVSPNSSQIGFFIDPQDFRNKDILRFFGNTDIMDIIGDPHNLYSSRYSGLTKLRTIYSKSGNKRVFFNELITLYKFYFNKDIFESIKQIIPARSNVLTGLLIEPSILERSKYQNKNIDSDITSSYYESNINNIVRIDVPLYSEFKYLVPADILNHPPSFWSKYFQAYYKPLWNQDLGNGYSGKDWYYYLNSNLLNINNVYWDEKDYRKNLYQSIIDSLPDDIHNELSASIQIPNISGSVKAKEEFNYSETALNVLSEYEKDVQQESFSDNSTTLGLFKDYDLPVSSSNQYLLKKWSKRMVFNLNPDKTFSSSSIFTYTIIPATKLFYESLVYTSSFSDHSSATKPIIGSGTSGKVDIDESIINNWPTVRVQGDSYLFYHDSFTMKQTPNRKSTDFILKHYDFQTGDDPKYKDIGTWGLSSTNEDVYYEIFTGYPRNHYTHTRQTFSKERYATINGNTFTKGRQTEDTTIAPDRIDNRTQPIQQVNTGNISIINSNNTLVATPPQIPPPINTISDNGGGGCLLKGTRILLHDGSTKLIESIIVGDILLSDDRSFVRVLKLMPNSYNEYYSINNKLFITYEHPIMTIQNGQKSLKRVIDLEVGDLMVKYDGTIEKVKFINIFKENVNTYNFIVDGNNLYAAENIIVHNVTKIKF